MTERFVSKFSQIRGFEIPALRDGLPSYVAPRSAGIAAMVSYVVVYLLAGWILGGRLRAR